MDEDIAILLAELKEMGLEENTILIFMTDNGPCPWFGGIDMDFDTGYPLEGYSAGMRGGKIWGYENAHRVPFFIRWPAGGIGGGKDIGALSAQIDLMPTLFDLGDLKTPDHLELDGKSLKPLLDGREISWPERTLFVHNQRVEYPVKDKEYQVLTEKWRLVKREKDELYDIKADPGQRKDLAEAKPDIVKELYSRYEKWWEDTTADFDKYAEIHIGTEYENPLTLYSHDAHTRHGKKIWVVRVQRDGEYEFRLNRWPEESGKRILENGAGDNEVPIESAHLKIGNIELAQEVGAEMRSAVFVVNLKAGTTCLETWLTLENQGNTARTDCVYVRYTGEAGGAATDKYQPSVPGQVLTRNYQQMVLPFD